MKKIGIITWHFMENYGSALQCYALKTVVSDLGYKVEVINYRKSNELNKLRRIVNKIPYIMIPLKKLKLSPRYYKFFRFHEKYLNLSDIYFSNEELIEKANDYDIYICGSDQIWAPNLLDYSYMLDFVNEDKKKISYAPSVVIENFSDIQKEMVKKFLERFDSISVRENKGAEIINKFTNKDISVVLDPTFLLKSTDWDKIVIQPEIDEKYILCYLLGENINHRNIVNKFSKENGYKIVTLPFCNQDLSFGEIIKSDIGPREFLGLIKNAEYIFTDSFHGMALSINYKKQFYIFNRFKSNDIICQNERIHSILKRFDIRNRIIDNNYDFPNNKEQIEYDKVEEKLNLEREFSLLFLKKSLSGDRK